MTPYVSQLLNPLFPLHAQVGCFQSRTYGVKPHAKSFVSTRVVHFLISLHKQGFSCPDIGRKLQISGSRTRKVLIRHKMPRRTTRPKLAHWSSRGGLVAGRTPGALKALRFGSHTRWHVTRGIVNADCEFCKRLLLPKAA
jgi:hypothetical protein